MTVSYTLRSPFEHNGQTYKTLTFRESKTGDLMAADRFEGANSKIVAMLASMSGVPIPAFKEITQRDLLKIIEATASMLGEEEEAGGEA